MTTKSQHIAQRAPINERCLFTSDVDFFNETAKRCHQMPSAWRWCALDAVDCPEGFTRVTGAVPVGIYKSGKRKGRTKWPPLHECDTVWMRNTDIDETERLWSAETGLCVKCKGRGSVFASWSARDGVTLRECSECKGSGKAECEVAS